MALWGLTDNVASSNTVTLDYSTGIVTSTVGSNFGETGSVQIGNVIRFGERGTGVYYGDAVVVGIASTTQLTIGSTAGLNGSPIVDAEYMISELPSYTTSDVSYSEASYGTEDKIVYGISSTTVSNGIDSPYHVSHSGWVGVTTYIDMHGELRVKSEVLVAMSGIQTGSGGISYPSSV